MDFPKVEKRVRMKADCFFATHGDQHIEISGSSGEKVWVCVFREKAGTGERLTRGKQVNFSSLWETLFKFLEKEFSKESLPILNVHVNEFDFSVRTSNCLRHAGIETVGELVRKTMPELLATQKFGRKSLTEVVEKLKEKDLELGMSIGDVKCD